jgi:hypothetical protein
MRGEEHKHSLKTTRNNNNKNATKFPSFSFSNGCAHERVGENNNNNNNNNTVKKTKANKGEWLIDRAEWINKEEKEEEDCNGRRSSSSSS